MTGSASSAAWALLPSDELDRGVETTGGVGPNNGEGMGSEGGREALGPVTQRHGGWGSDALTLSPKLVSFVRSTLPIQS